MVLAGQATLAQLSQQFLLWTMEEKMPMLALLALFLSSNRLMTSLGSCKDSIDFGYKSKEGASSIAV